MTVNGVGRGRSGRHSGKHDDDGFDHRSIETFGDHDWFRIQLTAGQKITITLNGTTLQDPFLRILNSSGAILQENDDISSGVIRDSRIVFTAPTTGTYYIDAGAWQDNYVGDYQLNVTTYVAPSVWTYDQIADQLIRGYWGGDRGAHFRFHDHR